MSALYYVAQWDDGDRLIRAVISHKEFELLDNDAGYASVKIRDFRGTGNDVDFYANDFSCEPLTSSDAKALEYYGQWNEEIIHDLLKECQHEADLKDCD